MTPTKFASVRHPKPRPIRRPSFRDDTNLVALRYEKTIAAEPPIHMPPRSPRRPVRPESPSSTTSHHGSGNPIVVVPPAHVLAPPTEEHPALRNSTSSRSLNAEAWKRDSGHVPAVSPTTIFEEECEEDEQWEQRRAGMDEAMHEKLNRLAGMVAVSPAVQQGLECPGTVVEDRASVYSQDSEKGAKLAKQCTASTASGRASTSSSSYSLKSPPSTPTDHGSSSPKLIKSFSLRSVSSMLGRRSISEESTSTTSTTAAAQGRSRLSMRGWGPPSLRSLKHPPKSPTSSDKPSITTNNRVWIKSPNPSLTSSISSSDYCDLETPYSPLVIDIPTDSLLDDDFVTRITFSDRGSVMFGGRRPLDVDGAMEPHTVADNDAKRIPMQPAHDSAPLPPASDPTADAREPEIELAETQPSKALTPPDIRVLAADIEKESQKVRSLYNVAAQVDGDDAEGPSSCDCLEPCPEAPGEQDEHDVNSAHLAPNWATSRPGSASPQSRDSSRRQTELAGGLEDWEDLDGSSVDRYGFIKELRPASRLGTPTEGKLAPQPSKRRNVLQKRDFAGLPSFSGKRPPSRKVSARSLHTTHSEVSIASFRSSRSALRHASNLLPHNRDRRYLEEAGDMLSISPSLQDVTEEIQVEKISEALKRKEWDRSEKWRKMAKVIKRGDHGQGMEFEFDVKNPKLIERTWKGIPDRWRAVAWWSFLETSAKDHKDSPSPETIIADFHRLQDQSSPDDVQIDLDVPRTVNRHVMFRKRYRGGQRLLFRVLHAISIYFPETGYGQGMASLAATLLCYFDEEKSFVMMVRMWQLRGLDVLYRPQFQGLIAALKEFEASWLNKDVAKVLRELDVDVTAYGTKWYLTLFNLSVPFAAQLRIWDVFLLLGDGAFEHGVPDPEAMKPTGLDILHATSAALIQGLKQVLLGSDFENAMKSLTSSVPIKDEDILLKVMKAEWKTHQGRKKS